MAFGKSCDVFHANGHIALLALHLAPLVPRQLNSLRDLVDVEVVGHAQFAVRDISGEHGLHIRHVAIDELSCLDQILFRYLINGLSQMFNRLDNLLIFVGQFRHLIDILNQHCLLFVLGATPTQARHQSQYSQIT